MRKPSELNNIFAALRATFQYYMGSIDIIKPLTSVLIIAINKSQQQPEKNYWECWELNPGQLGEKHVCYQLEIIVIFSALATNFSIHNKQPCILVTYREWLS